MFALLWEILIGLVVGALAKLFMPGKDPGGILVIYPHRYCGPRLERHFFGQLIGWYKQGQSAGFIMSILGAMLILWIYRMIKRRTATA